MKKIFTLLAISLFPITGCEEDYEHSPIAKDINAPKPIENLIYEPIRSKGVLL